MTIESIETSTSAESPRLTELRNSIYDLSTTSLVDISHGYNPDTKITYKKRPEWLSLEAHNLLDSFLCELDLNVNDIVCISDTVDSIDKRQAISTLYRQHGVFVVIDKKRIKVKDLNIVRSDLQAHAFGSAQKLYNNYLNLFDSTYEYRFRSVGNSNYIVSLKKVFFKLESDKIEMTSRLSIEERFSEIGHRSEWGKEIITLDGFSTASSVYSFMTMRKL